MILLLPTSESFAEINSIGHYARVVSRGHARLIDSFERSISVPLYQFSTSLQCLPPANSVTYLEQVSGLFSQTLLALRHGFIDFCEHEIKATCESQTLGER